MLPERDHRLLHPRDRRLGPDRPLPRRRGDRGHPAGGRRAGHPARHPDARDRQRLRVHRQSHTARPLSARSHPPPRRLPRPRVPGVHRVLVPLPQRTLRVAQRVRDPRPGPGGDRRLHRPLPRPAPQPAELPNTPRSPTNLGRSPQDNYKNKRPELSTPGGSAPSSSPTLPRRRVPIARRELVGWWRRAGYVRGVRGI